ASHSPCAMSPSLFFFTHTPPTEIYTLSLHDALPISIWPTAATRARALSSLPELVFAFGLFMSGLLAVSLQLGRTVKANARTAERSEEHTSELQSRFDLVCRLLLEKKKQ